MYNSLPPMCKDEKEGSQKIKILSFCGFGKFVKLNLLAVKKNYAGHYDSCEQILALEGPRQKCTVEKTGLGSGEK